MEKQGNKNDFGKMPKLTEDEKVIAKFYKGQYGKALSVGITKACAFPELGFRPYTLENGNMILIVRRNEKQNKIWEAMTSIV